MFCAAHIFAIISIVLLLAVSVLVSELKWAKRMESLYCEMAARNDAYMRDALERNAELAKALGELGNLIGSLKGGAVDAVLEAIKSAERFMGGSNIVPMADKEGE